MPSDRTPRKITTFTEDQWRDARQNGYRRVVDKCYELFMRDGKKITVLRPHFYVEGKAIIFGEKYGSLWGKTIIYPLDLIHRVDERHTRYLVQEPTPTPPAEPISEHTPPGSPTPTISRNSFGVEREVAAWMTRPPDKIQPNLPPTSRTPVRKSRLSRIRPKRRWTF